MALSNGRFHERHVAMLMRLLLILSMLIPLAARAQGPGPGGLGISLVTDGTTTVTGTRQMVFTGGGATVTSGGLGTGIVDVAIVGGLTIGAPVSGCSVSGYVFYNNANTVGCENLAGGGNVINVGTPTNGQLAQWTDATHIQGFTLGTNVATALGQVIGGTTGLVIGGANSNLTSLTGLTTPLSVAQGGTGTATPGLVAGTNVTITGSWPNQTVNSSGGISGLTVGSTTIASGAANRVLIDNGGTLQELAYGLTGNSTVVETTSGGLITASLLPLATTGAFGAVKPDGTTITISAGVISSVGGAATAITPGTTTVVGATAPCFLVNSASTTLACDALGPTLAINSNIINTAITDTVHTTSATTANIGGQDDYNGSSITATLATLAAGQTVVITDQNASALTVALGGQTVVGLPLATTLHTGGFYGFTFNSLGTLSGFGSPGFGTITTGALCKFLDGTGACTAASASDVPATPLATGTSVSLAGPRQYYVCTGTCTVTPPAPVAGYEFCVLNDDNVSTVITLAALGSSARYENTARTAYGTAGTGTFISGGAVGDKVCIVGRDATHYLTTSFNGTWVAS